MQKPIRFAIIGCGRIAQRHAAEAVKHGVIHAVCDTDVEKANSLAETYNALAYFFVEELISAEREQLDII